MIDQGTIVGSYAVERFLDEGGMAQVYHAVHVETGTSHALKVLLVRDPETRRRLVEEGRVLTHMRHPNIVGVSDVIEFEGRPALVMEFVDGPALDTWLNESPRPWSQRKRVFDGLVSGLAYAHQRGIVHRDLQPANILLDRNDKGEIVARIIDFGLAKNLQVDSTTRTGSTLGTPGYMAPEQIRDSKNIDARADIFALGCLLYVLVCECEPFDGEDILEIFNNTCIGKYEDPALWAPKNLDPSYLRAIEGCLRVSPNDRITDAAELLDVLDGAELPPPTDESTLMTPTKGSSAYSGGPVQSRTALWLMSLAVAVAAGLLTWTALSG